MSITSRPKVSIIIPSWTGEVERLMRSIEGQSFRDYEVNVVRGVSPAARARNLGAEQAGADILFFVDDDAYLGHEDVLQRMVDLLENDEQTAIVGISQQVPLEASWLQKAIARQVPRYASPIVFDNLLSNPPLDSYGFTAITTLCCAVRRTVFEEVGGFDEELPTGEDTDFFYRIRCHGHNLIMAANCWVYHDPPASLTDLVRKSFWYGVGHALEARKSPDRGMAVLPLNRWYGQLGLLALVLGFPLAFFVHYYFDPLRRLVFGFRPLKTLSTYASLCGYVYGWYRGKPRKASATYGGVRGGRRENAETGDYHKMSGTSRPKVSIIIPSWTGEVHRLKQSIEEQTFGDYEVNVVVGISPAARARNLGARQAGADILLFVDDDAYLGHEDVLQRMVDLLENDGQTAIVGTSKLVSVEASRFQHAIARQVPRWVYPVVFDNLLSNPPLNSYGFTAITTTCCAVRRTVFEEAGGFDEELPTGPEDTDFFYRIRCHGHNLVVAANCWVYHDPPASIKALLRKSFWYGVGHALEAKKNPERGMAVLPLNRWYGQLGLLALALGFPFAFFVHYYFDPLRRLVFGFRPLKTLSTYASLCGYVYGWYRGKPGKAPATYGGVRGGRRENAEVQTP